MQQISGQINNTAFFIVRSRVGFQAKGTNTDLYKVTNKSITYRTGLTWIFYNLLNLSNENLTKKIKTGVY